jgi:hypothetical protein
MSGPDTEDQEEKKPGEQPEPETDDTEEEGSPESDEGDQLTGDDETPAGDEPASGRDDDLQTRLDALERQNRELLTEVAFNRGRQEERRAAQPDAPDEEEEEEEDIPDEELEAGFVDAKTAARTMKKYGGVLEKRVEKRLRKEFEERQRSTTQVSEARRNDEALTYQKFPELRSNQEFFKRTDEVLRAMYQRNGGRYLKGDVMMAAASIFGEMVDEGLMEPRRGRNGNGNGRPGAESTGTRETVRQVQTGLRRSAAAPVNGNRSKDPFAGLNMSKNEQARVLKRCREFGQTPEQWRKNYDAAAAERM